MVSVIIPTHDRLNWLKECVNSVVRQDVDYEIILVDDVGNAEDYKNYDNVKYFKIKKCRPTEAINYGFKKAQGEYITLLPDDDLLCQESLKSRLEGIKGYDVIYSGAIEIHGDGKEKRKVEVEPVDKDRIWTKEYINMITMLWSKKVHDKIGYFAEYLEYFTDWDWKVKCLMSCKATCIPDYTIKHRRHNGQETRKFFRQEKAKQKREIDLMWAGLNKLYRGTNES